MSQNNNNEETMPMNDFVAPPSGNVDHVQQQQQEPLLNNEIINNNNNNNTDFSSDSPSSGSPEFFINNNNYSQIPPPVDNNMMFMDNSSSPPPFNMNYSPPSFTNQFNPNQIYQASHQYSNPQQNMMNFTTLPIQQQSAQLSLVETIEQNNNYIPPEKRSIRPLPLAPFMEGFDSMEQIQKQLQIKKAIETMTESCVSKSVFAAVAGTVLGGAFGIISASFTLENTYMKTPQQIIREESMTSREKIREYFRDTKTRCVSMGKSFGMVGALYSFFECSLEKTRGKKDIKGSFMAGCISGAVLARNAGVGPIVLGCATFGAFSSAIDYFTEYT